MELLKRLHPSQGEPFTHLFDDGVGPGGHLLCQVATALGHG